MKEGRGPYTSALPLEAQRRKWPQSKAENIKEENMVPQERSRKISAQVGRVTQDRESPEGHARLLSRRSFIRHAGLMAAAMALLQAPEVLSGRGWIQPAYAAKPDPVHDTFNGLLAFVVPGSDPYSGHQGVSTAEPGGVDVGITDVLIASMDQAVPFRPNFSVELAGILNGVAEVVNPSASGPYSAPFANLSFPEKVAVFSILEGGGVPELRPFVPLVGVLPQFVAFLVYSEVGVFDPKKRTLTGTPLGWTLSNYEGVADGRDEFKGYYQDRRKVT
jgi:hypothetical protein